MRRIEKKIDAINFIILMCMESPKGSPSYNLLASRMDAVCDVTASKQAFCKRVNQSCVEFFKAVLAHLIESKYDNSELDLIKRCKTYKRVLVQDSTIIRLPIRLFSLFSGVSNSYANVCNARIQGVYDLLSGCFISFSIDPYSKNDLDAASELDIHKGDLVLRDRGYLHTKEVNRHVDIGADCIFRHRLKINYLYPDTGKPIELLTLLEKHGSLDMEVCLNIPERTKVRLVAFPVSPEVANQRRRKAKKDMHGHNPCKRVLQLMSWTIFITTIPKSQADGKKLLMIYRLRWKIEIIFKIWKSHLQFDKIHNVSECQLYVLIISRFILILLYTNQMYQPCETIIKQKYNRQLSMVKFFKYAVVNPEKVAEIIAGLYKSDQEKTEIFKTLKKYCSYDKRKRMNYNDLLRMTLLS